MCSALSDLFHRAAHEQLKDIGKVLAYDVVEEAAGSLWCKGKEVLQDKRELHDGLLVALRE